MKKLTLKDLKEMTPDRIFAIGKIPPYMAEELDIVQGCKWIATRGGIHDWAIYYQRSELENSEIKAFGTKLHDNNAIRVLVPCTNEAFGMYRH